MEVFSGNEATDLKCTFVMRLLRGLFCEFSLLKHSSVCSSCFSFCGCLQKCNKRFLYTANVCLCSVFSHTHAVQVLPVIISLLVEESVVFHSKQLKVIDKTITTHFFLSVHILHMKRWLK